MRAFTTVSPHRVLFALALLAPAVLFSALARSSWIEAGTVQRAQAAVQLARARDDVASLVQLDRVVLDELRARLPPPAATVARADRPLAWLSPAALPPIARRQGGVIALFVADAAGTLRPQTPAAARGQPPDTLQGFSFFHQLLRGAALAIGSTCPVTAAGDLAMPASGFVLAEPLDAVAAPSRGTPAGRMPIADARREGLGIGSTESGALAATAAGVGGSFRGVIGACIVPRMLAQAWRRRLGPAEAMVLAGADGRALLQVSGSMPFSAPDSADTVAAPVAETPLRVVFSPAPSARWQAWYPSVAGGALLALAVALVLAAAARTARRQYLRAAQALAATERFADVLRLSAERYRQLYLGAPAAMHALDPSWRIVAVTDRWLSLLGYRREEVLGHRFESFLAPAARPAAEHDWTRLLAGDQPPPARRRLLRQDGTALDLTVAEQAERDPDGRLRRALVLLMEPATPVGREAGRPDILARVTGGIAHDFNNLLMVVMGSLERLIAQADRPDTVRRLAGMALAAAERGAGLTTRLLAAAGRQSLRPELVNANRLLREAADAITQAAGPKVEVQFLLSPVLDPARLDPAQFRAAVLALVANAREAMPRGGRLSIETANVAGPTPQEGQILVSLSDTGAGMDATVLARAIEPFFTTRPPGRASGLGLSMAEGFARQSGGSLEIESEPGIGSTIRLLLPRSTDPAPPGEPDAGQQTVPDEAGHDKPHARPGGTAPWSQAKG